LIKLGRRGSVLVHVLITGVIVAFIAAGLLRMVLMNYIAVDRATKGAQNRKEAEAMLQRALTYWNQTNSVCSTTANFPCTGGGVGLNQCNCNCPNGTALPRVEVTGGGAPPCAITIISSDPE
jgi:Tfp pilus assembly protein PilX